MALVEGLIRFNNGEVKVFMFCTTSNVIFNNFFENFQDFEFNKDLFKNNSSLFFNKKELCNCHKIERVEFYLNEYSKYWIGSACKNCKTILTGLDPCCNYPIYNEDEIDDELYSDYAKYDNGDEGFPRNIVSPIWASQKFASEDFIKD